MTAGHRAGEVVCAAVGCPETLMRVMQRITGPVRQAGHHVQQLPQPLAALYAGVTDGNDGQSSSTRNMYFTSF